MAVKLKYYKQKTKYTCGPAAMKMVLDSLGIKETEDMLSKVMKSNKIKGTSNKRFPGVAEYFKLDYVVKRRSNLKKLKWYLKKDYKIIICYYDESTKEGHYSVIKKIGARYIYLLDPWYGPDKKFLLDNFKKIWKNSPKGDKEYHWFIAIKK